MTSPRKFVRWAVAHSQALGLSFLLAVAAAAALWFFAFFVPGKRQTAIGEWRRDLSLVAETRRNLLERRISEELAEASYVATFPSALTLFSPDRIGTSGEGSVPHLEAVLSNFRRVGEDRSVSIRNAEGVALASSDGPAPGPDAVALAREAARVGEPRVDLVREPDGFTGLVVAVPIRESSRETGAGARGAALIVGNARQMFDLLAPPVRTAHSGEALLVRKDGDQILFLSPLLFRKDPPLTFRVPFETPGLAARAALAGENSFSSYVDYRKARVLAAGLRLEGAPWGLVIKIDEDEALAPFHRDVLRNGLTWSALLLALVAAAFGLWRALVASQEATLARSEARLGALLEQGTDAILLIGSDGRVLEANRAAEKMYGRASDELLTLHLKDLRATGTLDALGHDMEMAIAQGGLLLETRHRRADGSEFPVEVNIGIVKEGDETLFLSTVRDISRAQSGGGAHSQPQPPAQDDHRSGSASHQGGGRKGAPRRSLPGPRRVRRLSAHVGRDGGHGDDAGRARGARRRRGAPSGFHRRALGRLARGARPVRHRHPHGPARRRAARGDRLLHLPMERVPLPARHPIDGGAAPPPGRRRDRRARRVRRRSLLHRRGGDRAARRARGGHLLRPRRARRPRAGAQGRAGAAQAVAGRRADSRVDRHDGPHGADRVRQSGLHERDRLHGRGGAGTESPPPEIRPHAARGDPAALGDDHGGPRLVRRAVQSAQGRNVLLGAGLGLPGAGRQGDDHELRLRRGRRHGAKERGSGAGANAGAARAGAEDGGRGTPRGRGRPRLQQPSDGHSGLRRNGARLAGR